MKVLHELWLYRQELTRRASFWRNLAIIFLITGLLWYSFPKGKQGDYIGRIVVEGQIFEDRYRDLVLSEIENNSRMKALVVSINSPGGSVFGGEALYSQIRNITKKKPVVVVMGTTAASAGYMAALAGDHIVARNSTITGSIGVLFISAEVTELAKKIGVEFIVLKSGPLKAEPLPFTKLSDKVKEQTMNTIMDSYDMFVNIVSERRNLTKEKVLELADGRIFTGRQAHQAKLIDAIGTEQDALNWLYDNKKINKNLKVIDVRSEKPEAKVFDKILGSLFNMSNYFKFLF